MDNKSTVNWRVHASDRLTRFPVFVETKIQPCPINSSTSFRPQSQIGSESATTTARKKERARARERNEWKIQWSTKRIGKLKSRFEMRLRVSAIFFFFAIRKTHTSLPLVKSDSKHNFQLKSINFVSTACALLLISGNEQTQKKIGTAYKNARIHTRQRVCSLYVSKANGCSSTCFQTLLIDGTKFTAHAHHSS